MPIFNFGFNLFSTNKQTNIVGISPEQLAVLVRQHNDHSETQKKLIARLETDLNLNERQMRQALRILGENEVADEQLGAKLVEIANHFANLKSRVSEEAGDSSTIVALKLQIQKAVDAGELARVDTLLEEIEREQRHDVERSAISLAGTLARRAEIALTRLRYDEAARHFASAAAILPFGIDHNCQRISYLNSEAAALYQQGEEFGDNAALLSAIERYQRLVTLSPRARVPLDWAQTQSNLGNVLRTLGTREGGTARLEEAVAACRAALEERTRVRVPLNWGESQNNLGAALWMLGKRKNSTALLEKAVAAFRAALEEITPETASYQHEVIQRNVANCLVSLEQLRKQ